MGEAVRTWTNKLGNILCSMKTGLILLCLIAVVLGLDTFFPRVADVGQIHQTYGFEFLVGLLCVNLLVCNLRRFKRTYRRVIYPALPEQVMEVPLTNRMEVTGPTVYLQSQLEKILRREGFRIHMTKGDKFWSFNAQRHRAGYWGSYLVHVSFFIILVGAIAGIFFGFSGHVTALSGETVSFSDMQMQKGVRVKNYRIRINAVEDRLLANGERDNWYSDISVLQGENEVKRGVLSVNHPLTFDGITYFQKSYTDVAQISLEMNGKNTETMISLTAIGDEKSLTAALENCPVQLIQGSGIYVKALRLTGQPVVYLQLEAPGEQTAGWMKLHPGESAVTASQDKITLKKLTNATGLGVKADPGIPAVYLGCAVLVLGLGLSFYWRPMVVSGICMHNTLEGTLTFGWAETSVAGVNADRWNRIKAEVETSLAALKEYAAKGI